MTLSCSTIHRALKARKEHAEIIRSEFVTDPLVLHWDGKILPDIFGAGNVDCLPVLVMADGVENLFGVPKVVSGTGYNESLAVYNLLENWKLTEKVQALCFDTISANTRRFNGVCFLQENKIGHELLLLACCHHVLELILAKCSYCAVAHQVLHTFQSSRDSKEFSKVWYMTTFKDWM